MKRASIIVTVILVVLQLCSSLWALPTTAYDAEMVVTGWLKADPKPLGSDLSRQIMSVETFTDDHGEAIYHVVYLQPSGFVIVSTDDLVEPIIAFAGNGTYDPSPGNPLEALVTKDLKGRILAVRSTFVPLAIAPQAAVSETQKKWNSLIGLAEVSNGGFEPMAIAPICDDNLSDLRVPPLVHSKWGQSNYYDGDNQPRACYNYCTPQLIGNRVSFVEGQADNYPCGCVAITVAQFMRSQEYPEEPVEPAQFTILVEESKADRWLLRGDGPGGAYNWDDMVAVPGDETTEQQRRAIGVLCHDAAIAVDTQFGAEGSGASLDNVVNAFLETFQYKNAVWAEREGGLLDRRNFISLINPNLDAGIPVIIGFRVSTYKWIGHAALCDGYGYNLSILYHHLNMGWEGQEDCWYALPDIACPDMVAFDVITQCAYNIFTDCTGEIISGRIIDPDGRPMEDITVTAQGETDTDVHTAVTNRNGIYAFKGLDSETAYTIAPDRMGYDFDMNLGYDYTLNIVRTGRSGGESFISGNRWGVDFVGYRNSVTITIGQEISAWDYPMHTEHHDSRAQVIYLAGEIARSGTITALALDIAEIPDGPMTDWTIRIKHTGLSEYTSASLDAAGWTEVYRTSESDVGEGWQKFEFQTPFEYNGTDNLMVDFSHNNLSGSQNGQCRASSPGPMRTVFAQSNSEYKNPLDWSGTASPATYLDDHVPNLRVMFSAGESQVVSADTKLTASDGERNDHFGCSVSISGDYAIVGADGEDSNRGAAYIFKREGIRWAEQAKLRMPLPRQYDDFFGHSVSISGDYAVVGSGNIEDRRISRGNFSAFIFKRDGTNWTLQTELNAHVTYYARFGNSVSISGDFAIVGSPHGNSSYIFKCSDTGWTQQAKLVSVNEGGNHVGNLVSISSNYAIMSEDISGRDYGRGFGPAYIFQRNGTSWTEQAKLISPNAPILDAFGYSISISSDYAVIGAPEDDTENESDAGSVYVFKREGTNWTEQARLIGLDSEFGPHFGSSVSISGDYVIVGSPDDSDHYNGRRSGSAYLFKCDGGDWTQCSKLVALDGQYDDFFGTSVAIDGDYVIVGAPNDDDSGRDSGSVYIFKRIGSTWMP